MIIRRNQKGIVLITAYMVILVLAVLSAAFFMRTFQEKRLSQQQNESMKAFYNAEKALSYAYLESASAGWTWFTHHWDTSQTPHRAVSNNLTSADAVRTQGANADCHFIASGLADEGCYVANDGSFILKTFSDPHSANMTVVRAKGISGNVERVIEYRISRSAIYDFAWWTPYDLNLNNVGSSVNGGRIHSGGNIYMYNSKRLYGVDLISTGKDKGIYYNWNTYYGPGYYDWYMDGTYNINGEVPVPDLGKRDSGQGSQRWAGTSATDPYGTQYPWKYESGGNWYWRSFGYEYAGYWPPAAWKDEESFFYGDNQARYNTTVDGNVLNSYNTWIYPAQKDADGEIVLDASGNVVKESPQQIPAELEGSMWDWTKYNYYGVFGNSPQQALKFTVYDPDTGAKKYVEDTRWKIVTNADASQSVVMTGLDDPTGVTYWNMLQRYDYWKALGYSDADATTWSTHINPELLDGTYGSEVPAGQTTMKVDNTNSMKQPEAWNNFLQQSGLDDVVLANEKGEDMEAPKFATTYKEKSKTAGFYLSKSGDEVTLNYANGTQVRYPAQSCPAYNPDDSDAYDNWLKCMEDGIDVLVTRLNTDADENPLPESKSAAKKVKFINTYTNKMNVVLELDLDKMDKAGVFPVNGIIYSEVPVRLSNAQRLPSTGDPKKDTFNLISEENIYLKGDYNNPASDVQWMTSAIISKKQIYSLSNDFNDPQVSPAFVNYPNYPYVYVKKDAADNLIEANPSAGDGSWVYYRNYFSTLPQYTQALNLLYAINADWQNTFDKNDPSGNSLYTVSSTHPIIDGQTWGAMPNRVQNNHTYNCLIASYYYGYQRRTYIDGQYLPRGSLPYGVNLERWINDAGNSRTKTMKGAYFQLDWGEEDDEDRFTAHKSDGPIDFYYYSGANYSYPWFDYRSSSRVAGSPYSGPYYLSSSPRLSTAYDSRFRNPLITQAKPIFFGGGESSWRELSVSSF